MPAGYRTPVQELQSDVASTVQSRFCLGVEAKEICSGGTCLQAWWAGHRAAEAHMCRCGRECSGDVDRVGATESRG